MLSPPSRHFCTYFDRHYLARGLALYESLDQHASPFVLHVLCLDEATRQALTALRLPHIAFVSLQEFEANDPALAVARGNRSRVEYYFTCSPSWALYVLEHQPDADTVTYVDADLYFFGSPDPIYDELGEESILIVGHRFPDHLRHLERFGKYNVGLLAFRRGSVARECLRWWRERCLEWCHDRVEDGRFADQRYLDDWPARFPGVVVLRQKGAGLAPWNWMRYDLSIRDSTLRVDGQVLVFFHFHGLRMLSRWLYDPQLARYGQVPSRVKRWLYGRYIKALERASCLVTIDADGEFTDPNYSMRALMAKLRRGQLLIRLGPVTW